MKYKVTPYLNMHEHMTQLFAPVEGPTSAGAGRDFRGKGGLVGRNMTGAALFHCCVWTTCNSLKFYKMRWFR